MDQSLMPTSCHAPLFDMFNNLNLSKSSILSEFCYEELEFHEIIASELHMVKRFLHKPSGTFMAVKFIPMPVKRIHSSKIEDQQTKLLRELDVHKLLNLSENIVTLYGTCIHEGYVLICMELMDMSVQDLCEKMFKIFGHFPIDLLGSICVSIVNALCDIQSVGAIHRDIKPNNILVNKNGDIKICDFGESKVTRDNPATTSVGTMAYWAPERFDSDGNCYDNKSDVWSLGITLAEIFYGRIPYEDHNGVELKGVMRLQNYIRNLDVEQLLSRCFKSEKVAADFVRLCLQNVSTRPTCNELRTTKFYLNYCNNVNDIVSKYLKFV